MSRDKQIEEMAKIICTPTANKGNCDRCGFKRSCSKFDDATDLYNAGYRKASDVAREIFEEIEDIRLEHSYGEIDGNELNVKLFNLKKKYESEGI